MRGNWNVHPESGSGLLRLPVGWNPATFQAAQTEIGDAGWEIVPHEDWYVHLMSDSYYLLRPVNAEPRPRRRKTSAAVPPAQQEPESV